MRIPKREALRYLGCGPTAPDAATDALVDRCLAQLEATMRPRWAERLLPVDFPAEGVVRLGPMVVESRNLYKNLAGCTQAAICAATLGVEVDRLMRTASLTHVAEAAALQAAAAAAIEEWCNQQQGLLAERLLPQGGWLRPRFSPGYGDFSIHHQAQLLTLLEAPKRIGLTLTDGLMLAPLKSVTAVIGIGSQRLDCPPAGCEDCGKTDCAYKRS